MRTGKNRPRTHATVDTKIAERIKRARIEYGETQENAAAACEYGITQYRRIESGKVGVDMGTLEKLAEHWKITVHYLTGEEDEPLTPLQYAAKQSLLHARNGAVDELLLSVKTNDEQRAILFRICGYEYEHAHTALIDFAPVSDSSVDEIRAISPNDGQHLIRSLNDTGSDWIAFTEAELCDLLDRLKDMIAFECFRKERGAEHDD